jgi:mono/diheme cytochrome c family protein
MTRLKQGTRVFEILVVVLAAMLLLSACGAQPTTPPTSAANAKGEYSFTQDVLPIFQTRCQNCHGSGRTQAGLNLSNYASLMAGSQNGPVIVAGDASSSKLIQMVQQGKMPKSGPKLLPDQLMILINWAQAGAKDN